MESPLLYGFINKIEEFLELVIKMINVIEIMQKPMLLPLQMVLNMSILF